MAKTYTVKNLREVPEPQVKVEAQLTNINEAFNQLRAMLGIGAQPVSEAVQQTIANFKEMDEEVRKTAQKEWAKMRLQERKNVQYKKKPPRPRRSQR
jgi:hypothetical protein